MAWPKWLGGKEAPAAPEPSERQKILAKRAEAEAKVEGYAAQRRDLYRARETSEARLLAEAAERARHLEENALTFERMDRNRERMVMLEDRAANQPAVVMAAAAKEPMRAFREYVGGDDLASRVLAKALAARGVRPETLQAPQFEGAWVEMAHTEAAGRGVSPAIERSGLGHDGIRRVVVVERAFDALAHYQMNPEGRAGTMYLKVGEDLTPARAVEVKETLQDLCRGVTRAGLHAQLEVVAAFSATRGGAEAARAVRAATPLEAQFAQVQPLGGSTWGEALKVREQGFIREQGVRVEHGRGRELER